MRQWADCVMSVRHVVEEIVTESEERHERTDRM